MRVTLSLALCVGTVPEAIAQSGDEGAEADELDTDPDAGGRDDERDERDQPAVTAGGLFTKATYPVRETARPLSMTQGIAQLRLGVGTDLSAKGAFESWGLNLEGTYGYTDHFALIGGITNAYNFKQFSAYFGFEGALIYDLINVRVAANVHRNAIAEYMNFCTPASANDARDQPQFNPEFGIVTPTLVDPAPPNCGAPSATLINLPSGRFSAGGTQFSIDIGLPFRYAIRPEIAVVALQTLMSIDFNSVDNDHVITSQLPLGPDDTLITVNTPARNGVKPDLKPSIGITTSPIAQLNVLVFAQLRIPDFDTQAGAFQVPVTGRLEVSPSHQFDVGVEFTLLNLVPPSGQSPIDNRFLSLFMQVRH